MTEYQGTEANNLKSETIMELPEQIIRYEIFTRLPVKSLVRFKSVCKSWLSLLSDPKFAKEHYHISAMLNPNEYDCLLALKCQTKLVSLTRLEETRIVPLDRHNSRQQYELIGSIHGLVCLRQDKKLWLWNPAIHQSKEFTLPRAHTHGWRKPSRDYFGFGFDHVSNDYKVVLLSTSYERMSSAYVYSYNWDAWSPLIVPDYFCPENVFPFPCEREVSIVKDCPYWTLYCRNWSDEFVVLKHLKFEIGSNEFRLLPEFQWKSGKFTTLVNMMDRPSLMDYEQNSGNISVDVYSLDEENGVWSRMYSVGPIANYGLRRNLSQGFKYGGEIVFEAGGMFSYYDQETDRIIPIPGESCFSAASCYRYTPSLVYLEGMTVDTP